MERDERDIERNSDNSDGSRDTERGTETGSNGDAGRKEIRRGRDGEKQRQRK